VAIGLAFHVFAMGTQLIRRASQVEEELAARRAELSALQAELADRELSLTTLLAELASFQGRYLREVGVLYAELDAWNARIAELLARCEDTEQAHTDAAQARVQAEQTARAVRAETAQQREFKPSLKLKRLYREVARKVHPDLATDNTDRARRERLMAEANAAYQRGDIEALQRVLDEYESGEGYTLLAEASVELERVIRQIGQIRSRLSQIEQQMTAFRASSLAKLKARADAAKSDGRDLLAEMALDVKGRIAAACLRFDSLSISDEVHEQ